MVVLTMTYCLLLLRDDTQSSFHFLIDEMPIILDNVSCLLHLLIQGKILNHSRTTKLEDLYMMVTYLSARLRKAQQELDNFEGAMLGFHFLLICMSIIWLQLQSQKVMMHGLHMCIEVISLSFGRDIHFMDKSVIYIEVIYLRYFVDIQRIHNYN